jgi:hypothetical protein
MSLYALLVQLLCIGSVYHDSMGGVRVHLTVACCVVFQNHAIRTM